MASRKEQKEQRRQERLAAEQAAAAHSNRRRTYGIVVGAVLVLAVIGAIVAVVSSSGGDSTGPGANAGAGPEAEFVGAKTPPPVKETELAAAVKKAGCVWLNPPIEGSTHVPASTKLKYSTNPAVSGNHDALPQPDGVYTKYPQPRHLLHALEHGRIEIEYDPKLPRKRIDQLGGIYKADNAFLLILPNPTMKYEVAVAAWGHLVGCKKVSDATYDVVRSFIDRYRGQGPEPPEAQLSVGTPGWPGEIPPFHIDGNTTGS